MLEMLDYKLSVLAVHRPFYISILMKDPLLVFIYLKSLNYDIISNIYIKSVC